MYQFSTKHKGGAGHPQGLFTLLRQAITKETPLAQSDASSLSEWVITQLNVAASINKDRQEDASSIPLTESDFEDSGWQIIIHRHGWSNLVFELNSAHHNQGWILRLPRISEPKEPRSEGCTTPRCRFELEHAVVETLRRQSMTKPDDCAAMPKDAQDTPLNINALVPNITLSEAPVTKAMLYPMLSGKPYDWMQASALSDNKLAKDIAQALALIHQPLSCAASNAWLEQPISGQNYRLDATLEPYPYGDNDFINAVLPIALELLPKDIANRALSYFTHTHPLYEFGAATNRPYQSVICHGDFGPANVLVSPSRRLAGIIDFSDVCIGDPAMDLAPLWRRTPTNFFELVLQYYEAAIGPERWRAIEPLSLRQRLQYHALRRAAFVIWFGCKQGTNGIENSVNYLAGHFSTEYSF